MRKWSKAGAAFATAVALCASLGAGSAFAAATTQVGGDGANWTVPTSAMTNTVWKDANGNLVAEGTAGATQYKVLTTWAEAWSTSGPDYLGVSNSAYYGNGGNGNPKVETYESAAKTNTVGVWATAANESPNAYNWNMFYNLYADTADGIAAQAEKTNWTAASTTTNGGSDWSTEAGVWCGFKYRPEIVWLNNNLTNANAKTYIKQINDGQYSATATAVTEGRSTTYTPDKNSEGGYDSSFAVYGDSTYNPEIIQPNNNSPYSFLASFYQMAEAADDVIAETAKNPGLDSGEALDWMSVNKLPRSSRYSETPTECAVNIERLAKGSVYYTLSKIADGTVAKKKVAYVAYPWSYSTTDRGSGATTNYTNETQVIVAEYDYTENIGSGPMDGRASWTPLVVDQLSTDTVYQAKTGGGSVNSSDNSTTTFTLYTASADDLATCDVIYCSPSVSKSATELQEWIEKNASSDTIAAKAKDISYLCTWPCITNGSNFTCEKLIYGAYGLDFIYPELFPSMQLSSYWVDEVYHITDSSLASAASWIYASASLPAGTTLSNIPAQYSLQTMLDKFDAGLKYYDQSILTTDEQGNPIESSDATIDRVLKNIALDGSTTLQDVVYAFNGFTPTQYWRDAAGEQNSTKTTFTDVDLSAWYANGVLFANANGLIKGYDSSTYGVGDSITRAQLALIMWRYVSPTAANTNPVANNTGLSDVADNQWYTAACNWAVANGIINGYQDASGKVVSFGPNDPITLEQLVRVFYNTLDPNASADTSLLNQFTDGNQVSDWAKTAVAWAVSKGVVTGNEQPGGTKSLTSTENIARERAATVIYKAYDQGVMQ